MRGSGPRVVAGFYLRVNIAHEGAENFDADVKISRPDGYISALAKARQLHHSGDGGTFRDRLVQFVRAEHSAVEKGFNPRHRYSATILGSLFREWAGLSEAWWVDFGFDSASAALSSAVPDVLFNDHTKIKEYTVDRKFALTLTSLRRTQGVEAAAGCGRRLFATDRAAVGAKEAPAASHKCFIGMGAAPAAWWQLGVAEQKKRIVFAVQKAGLGRAIDVEVGFKGARSL